MERSRSRESTLKRMSDILVGLVARPYSDRSVDSAVHKLEACAARTKIQWESDKQSQAAERDMLKSAEGLADVMQLAAGDQDEKRLNQIFGDEGCHRFWRVRHVLAEASLDPGSFRDARWQALQAAADTLEQALRRWGLLHYFEVGPPEAISYDGFPAVLRPGAAVLQAPTVAGGAAPCTLRWTVEPSLPPMLTLDAGTGAVTGRPWAGVEVEERAYKITASNERGAVETTVTFAIKVGAPEDLSYEAGPCVVGMAVLWWPKVSGGEPTSYSVRPALPKGLTIDPVTGAISGVPLRQQDAAFYTVLASNGAGESEFGLTLAVDGAPPAGLRYPEIDVDLHCGCTCYLAPEVFLLPPAAAAAARMTKLRTEPPKRGVAKWGRSFCSSGMYVGTKWSRSRASADSIRTAVSTEGMRFSVTPALPQGLHLSGSTGIISGHASAVAGKAVYRVTVENDAGRAHVDLCFAVLVAAPKALRYPDLQDTLIVGHPAAYSPEVQGFVQEFAVEPPLPEGLALDPHMGTITGIPKRALGQSAWRVTAKNEAGAAAANLRFAVKSRAPSCFSYNNVSLDYPLGQYLELFPEVDAPVESFSVSPPLPPGLALDSASGKISGSPSAAAELTTYQVVARNEGGSDKAVVSFEVKPMAPLALAYPHIDDVYYVGENVVLEPAVQGAPASHWTVDPALPEGLAIDASTGRIAGAPTAVTADTAYTVTGSSEVGGTSAVISFAVVSAAPSGLRYPTASIEHLVGSWVELEAELSGGAGGVGFAIDPPLPPRLELDPATGTICGEA